MRCGKRKPRQTSLPPSQPSLSATNASRFDEMEAEIKRNQAAFASATNKRLDKVENQAIRTMEVCQASSKSILELRKESNQQLTDLRNESSQQIQDLRAESARAMRQMRDEATANQHNLQRQIQQVLNSLHHPTNATLPMSESLASSTD